MPRPDEWLIAALESVLSTVQIAELRASSAPGIWEGVVRRGWVTDEQILHALSSRFHMKLANLTHGSPHAARAVSEALARRYHVVPLAITADAIDVATSNPHDFDCERTLAFVLGRRVRLALAAPQDIATRIDELYRPEQVIERILGESYTGVGELEAVADEPNDSVPGAVAWLPGANVAERPVIRLVDRIIAKAIRERASDIHLEAEEQGMIIRYRIDGVLKEDSVIPRALSLPLVARIKIMAQLDIADRLRPHDGRARVSAGGAMIDLRVSTLPAALGEKVVIRILDSRQTALALDALGLEDAAAARVQTMLKAREGMIVVTGPTGSGKTTLMYSIVRQLQQQGVNIVTVEDPVEYRLPGIVQVQVNEKTGLTFPAALRSILRQDPDVILIGEIRDRDTAQIAVQAALTGHLVLTTLHTIDASSAVTRLADLGLEPYKLAAALKGIVAQRLLRRLCQQCREVSTGGEPEWMLPHMPFGAARYRAVGCDECSRTGYRGRAAIVEVLLASAEVERRIAANDPPDRIRAAAYDAGMRPLWEAALHHVVAGTTSAAEVERVVEGPARATAEPARAAPVVRERPVRRAVCCAFVTDEETGGGRVVVEALGASGFDVHTADGAVEARTLLDRVAPDLIVIDVDAPRLDGFGVLRHLRARRATQNVPVIVLTANPDEETEVRVFEEGASDCVGHPVRPRILAARARALVACARHA